MVNLLTVNQILKTTYHAVVKKLATAVFMPEKSEKGTSKANFRVLKSIIVGVMILVAGMAYGAIKTSILAGGLWNTANTWSPTGIPANTDQVIITGPVTLNTAVTQATTGTLTINNGGTLTATNYNGTFITLTINSGGTLTCSRVLTIKGTTDITGTISLSGGRLNVFTGNVTLYPGASWTNTTTSDQTFSSDFINNATTFSSTGTGIYKFTGTTHTIGGNTNSIIPNVAINNTYINNGTLTVGTDLSGSGSLTNSSSGTLNINGTCSVATLINSGNIISTGSGTITSATVTNNLFWNMGGTGTVTAFTNAATGILNISATPTVPTFTTLNATTTGNIVNYNGAGAQNVKNTTYSNLTLSGGAFIKTLTNATEVSGVLTVKSGTTFSLGNNHILGATYAPSIVLENGSSGSIITGTGTSVLNFGGDVTVNHIPGTGFGAIISCPINLDNDRTITVEDDGTLVPGLSISGVISTAFGITKAGTGTLTLSGVNTYTGATTISSGILKLGATNTIPNTSALTVAGTFDLAGFSETVGSIAGTGVITSSAAGAPLLTTGIDNTNTTFSGIIQNVSAPSVTLIKAGNGTFTMSGTNTFTGGLTINSGSIQTGAANCLSNILPINLSGGTLGTGATSGFGDMVSTLTLSNNSILALGSGQHSLTFADSHLASWPAGTLTITGWTGNYDGATGSAGQIFVGGASGNGLTINQLAQIKFQDGSNNLFPAIQLSTGEVVPVQSHATDNFRSKSNGNWSTASNWQSSTDNITWITATLAPTNAASLISIQNAITVDVNNQTASSVVIASGGTLVAGSNTLLVSGDWTNNGGNFTQGTSTVTFTGNTTAINGTAPTQTFYNIITDGQTLGVGGSTTTLNISGTLNINDGTTFNVGAITLNITGATTIGNGTSGNLNINSATGTKTFTGDVTINAGATITESAAAAMSFGGSLTNNGTFTANSGIHTFTGTTKIIGGTSINAIPSVTISGNTTNSGTLTVITSLAGGSTLTNTGILNFGGTSIAPTLTAIAIGNTVNYTGVSQTVKPTTYSNLTLSGSGTTTTNTVSVNGILSMEGTATVTNLPNYGAASTLQYNTATPTTAGKEWPINFNGTGVIIANTGIITLNEAKTNTKALTIKNGAKLSLGIFSSTASTLTLAATGQPLGKWGGSGSTTATYKNDIFFAPIVTGVLTVSSSSCSTNYTWIGVKDTNWDIGANWCGGSKPTSIDDVTISSGINYPVISAAAACNSITINTGASLTINGSSTLTVSGNWINNGGTFNAGTGTVKMITTGKNIGGNTSTTFNNLTIGTNGGEDISLICNVNVNGVLTLGNNSLLTLGAYNLTLGSSATCIGSYNNNCMILDNGSGQLQKIVTSANLATSFLFPIGDVTSYSPLTLNFTKGTFDTGALVSISVTNTVHPQNLNSINYLKRYWTVTQTGISAFSCDVTGGITNYSDFAGYPDQQYTAEYVNGSWLPFAASPSSLSASEFFASGVSAFGDFTAMGFPSITPPSTSPAQVTYVHGLGPSSGTQFYVSGKNLVGPFVVTPPTDYEVSLDNTSYYSTPIIIPQSPTGTVAPGNAAVWFRLKAGLSVGSYTEDITCSTAGLVAIPVSVTGIVTKEVYCQGKGQNNSYYISKVVFNTIINDSKGSSANGYGDFTLQSTTISVGKLYNLAVTVNTVSPNKVIAKAWIDWNNDGIFNDDVTESYDLGSTTNNGLTIFSKDITVPAGANVGATRMRIVNSYNTVSNPCWGQNGEVEDYTLNIIDPIAISTSSLSGFSYAVGSGPSTEQSFTVKGSALTGDIVITAPENFEISTVQGGVFSTNPITLTQTGGIVNQTTMYVRLKAGLSAGIYSALDITLTSAAVPSKTVTCTGYVVPSVTVSGGGSYCTTEPINLTGTVPLGATYYWSGPNNFPSNSTTLSPTIPTTLTAANAGTYTLTADYLTGSEVIVNGGFEDMKVGFTSNYNYVEDVAGTQELYTISVSSYSITNIPANVHAATNGDFPYTNTPSHSGSEQLVVHETSAPFKAFWNQIVPVEANSNYKFSYWIQNVAATGTGIPPAQMRLDINGGATSSVFTTTATSGQWQQWTSNITTGNTTSLTLSLVNPSTTAYEFAVDDISMQKGVTASASVNVSVNIGNTPSSVLIAAIPSGQVSAGTSVTFTATPTNGGHPPTYQWKVNGVIPSIGVSTGSTYTSSFNNRDKVTCEMTSTSACKTGTNPYTSNEITMTVVTATKNYWKGSVDSNWSNPLNWTSNTVPASGDDVEFSTSTTIHWLEAKNDLTLDNADRIVNNLTNKSSKSLIIPPARCLTVNGNITTNGNPNQIQIKADPTGLAQNGSFIFPNATNVFGTVEMYSMASKNNTADATGNFYKWQFFGIPIYEITASPTFDGSYVRKWVESGTTRDTHWVSVDNSFKLQPGIGYEVTQDATRTIVFQGQLRNQVCTINNLPYHPYPALFPGQSILANPFTAAIDINGIQFGTDMNKTVWLYTTGSFGDWRNGSQYESVVPGPIGLGVTKQIPSMQAMVVQFAPTFTTTSAQSYVTIPYSATVKNSDRQRIKTAMDSTASDQVSLRIDINGSKSSDKMWLFSDSKFTRNFDNGWDGAKMLGSVLSPQLYAIEPDGKYQIDCIDDLNNTQLGFQAGEDNEYTLTFTHTNITTKYAALFLADISENKTVDITESGSTYTFIAEPSPVTVNRFKIVTRPYEKDASDADTQLKVFSSGNTVFVQNLGNQTGEMIVYDMMGRKLRNASFGPYGVTAVQVGSISGAYVVSAATSNEKVNKRLIIGK